MNSNQRRVIERKGPGDSYKLVATIPANEAFRPMSDGGCALVTAAR